MSIRDARLAIRGLVEAGELRTVHVENWREPAYLDPDAQAPRAARAATLLSPFDPLVWTRNRAARLFGFDYRIEIFVPQQKRQWGYYLLPFLLGDRIAARVDLRAARAERTLLVLAAYAEKGVDRDDVAAALAKELRTLASWLNLDTVEVHRRGNLASPLRGNVC
jgi:uncharacterized protein YcaQ